VGESEAPDIGVAAVVAAAQRTIATTAAPTAVDLPLADEPATTYGVWFADSYDPWQQGEYAGDLLVSVGRHDAARTAVTYGGPVQSTVQTLWRMRVLAVSLRRRGRWLHLAAVAAAELAGVLLRRRPGRRLPGTEREEPDERLHADRDRLPQQPAPGPAGHRRP
jgi:hypothetical protein